MKIPRMAAVAAILAIISGCAMNRPMVTPEGPVKVPADASKKVAVVPFDNVSGYFGVDEQFTKILVYRLGKAGYRVTQQTDTAKPQEGGLLIRGTVEKVLYFTSVPLDWYWLILPPWWIQPVINILYEIKNCEMTVHVEIVDASGKIVLTQDFEGVFRTPNTNETSAIMSVDQEIVRTLLTAL